jgi:hypothetical protein
MSFLLRRKDKDGGFTVLTWRFVNRKLALCHADGGSISLRFLNLVTPDMSLALLNLRVLIP